MTSTPGPVPQPRHAPATLRNRDAIRSVLEQVLAECALLLEIASGTGEHAAYMAPRLPGIRAWQPTDASTEALADIDAHVQAAAATTVRPALALDAAGSAWPVGRADAVLCCNMIHIAPWEAALGLFAGAGRVLPADGPLILYGPFRRHGVHTAPSNAAFDEGLRARDPRWGVRCLDREVLPAAMAASLRLDTIHAMPANNLIVVLRKASRE